MPMTHILLLLVPCLLAGCADAGGDRALIEQGPRPPAIAGDSALLPARAGPSIDPAEFLGIVHPPDPEGVGRLAWALVLTAGAPAVGARYTLEYVRTGRDGMLWLSRVERRVREGNRVTPTWRVVDAVTVPWPEPGERMQLTRCHDGDHLGVAAIVDRAPDGDRAYARQAWRVDWGSETIVEASPLSVWCEVPGAGEPVHGR